MHPSIERGVTMRRRMIIPERNQRPQLQNKARRASEYFILNNGCVLAVNHEHAFLNLAAFDLIYKSRERIEPEFLQISVALRIDHARILVCGKIITLAAEDQSLFQFGE